MAGGTLVLHKHLLGQHFWTTFCFLLHGCVMLVSLSLALTDVRVVGNMGQMTDYNNWVFIRHLFDTYGSVIRMHSFLGVSGLIYGS